MIGGTAVRTGGGRALIATAERGGTPLSFVVVVRGLDEKGTDRFTYQ